MKLLSFSYSEGGEWVKLVISEPQLPAERKVKDDCMETVFFSTKLSLLFTVVITIPHTPPAHIMFWSITNSAHSVGE